MEERPDAMDRKTSFNPEAVVFSPTTADESTTAANSRISALPNRTFQRMYLEYGH
jgi:hypothetical protein